MEGTEVISHGTCVTLVREEEDDDFRSCCEDEEVWKDTDEPLVIKEESTEDLLDEFSVKMFFKGLSINGVGDLGSCVSGIGVFIERPSAFPVIKVQKKLDFYVEEPVADCLALMDGLTECLQNNIRRVYAFTDSELLYRQISHDNEVEIPLVEALKERIHEHTSKLEAFVLKCVPSGDVDAPSKLAQVAMGVISFTREGDSSVDNCSICCEDKPCLVMITLKCSHKFCSGCMRSYGEGKIQSSQVPMRCPQETCKYYVSSAECKSFLTSASHDSFEKALREGTVSYSNRIYCPFPGCSVLIDPLECLSARASSSSGSDNSCIECPDCRRCVCMDCGVPWHLSMSCEEYQSIPLEERDSSDVTLHRLAQNKRWRRCQQCRTMIELTQGCYHMTCRCGQEFCYSCGAEYREGQQRCECEFWEEDNSVDRVTQSLQESEQWAWETFNSLPMIMDAYSDQEKSQLALIQRFLAGGFSLSDHHPYQSDNHNPPRCTDSYVDAIKDLHQLPWLERFVSVISDTYYEDYIQ